jgi:hypothetical protein
VPIPRASLDDRSVARGGPAAVVEALPGPAVLDLNRFVVGPDWVAIRRKGHIHLLTTESLAVIAVVAPSPWKQVVWSRGFVAPAPELVLRSTEGTIIKVPIDHIDPSARQTLWSVLGSQTSLTAVAKSFLASGALPDGWNRRLQFVGFRFGSKY